MNLSLPTIVSLLFESSPLEHETAVEPRTNTTEKLALATRPGPEPVSHTMWTLPSPSLGWPEEDQRKGNAWELC